MTTIILGINLQAGFKGPRDASREQKISVILLSANINFKTFAEQKNYAFIISYNHSKDANATLRTSLLLGNL